MFRRKPKTTFEQLPKDAQRLILHFNAEWNMQRITEGWAILCWERYKDLYHREGGVELYMLHLIKQMMEGKVAFHKSPYEQILWFKSTWLNFAPKHQITFNRLSRVTQFPHFLMPLMSKWLDELIVNQHYHPDWKQFESREIYPNSLQDSGLRGKLYHEIREHQALYLLWGSMWYGKAEYENILILLAQFIYHVAPKFQNPEKVASVLEDIMVKDMDYIKGEFLEYIKNCY